MAVEDLYSKRLARQLGDRPDVWTYDRIPQSLKVQIVHIWHDAIGTPDSMDTQSNDTIEMAYYEIAQTLRREYGRFALSRALLPSTDFRFGYQDLAFWFQNEASVDQALDAIELSFATIRNKCGKYGYIARGDNAKAANDAIEELNQRFKEHGVGYQFSDGKLFRVNSALLHTEAVVPALVVLRQLEYKDAQDEFHSAYEHYRKGKHAEALVDCCKSFESTMKIICRKRGWTFDPDKATAKDLVELCIDNQLVPAYWTSHFTGLRTMLTSGVPTPRNRQGGHGSATTSFPDPPDQLVAYVLHQTAATILFLVDSEKVMASSP